jgi:hypothetical protein
MSRLLYSRGQNPWCPLDKRLGGGGRAGLEAVAKNKIAAPTGNRTLLLLTRSGYNNIVAIQMILPSVRSYAQVRFVPYLPLMSHKFKSVRLHALSSVHVYVRKFPPNSPAENED